MAAISVIYTVMCCSALSIAFAEEPAACVVKYRECLQSCLTANEAEFCTDYCLEKHSCKIGECPYRHPPPCLFMANDSQECNTDIDCPIGKRCCRFGDLTCVQRCIESQTKKVPSSNPYFGIWNLVTKAKSSDAGNSS